VSGSMTESDDENGSVKHPKSRKRSVSHVSDEVAAVPDNLPANIVAVPPFCAAAEDVAENVVENAVITPKRRRGDGLNWVFVRKFPSMAEAMNEYSKEKLVERQLSKGRITRGKTDVYYFNCTMMTCGCLKKWRLRSSPTNDEFLEEETPQPHTNHDKHLRFEGRGISFAQEAIVEEALSLNLFKAAEIVNHFHYVAANGLRNGKFVSRLIYMYFVILYLSLSFCLFRFVLLLILLFLLFL
jgi:hypothetical protein